MKKIKIIISIILLSLAIGIANAQFLPCPVSGRISASGQNTGGLTVVGTNERTGESMSFMTTGQGEWILEWANAVKKYQIGDTIQIVIEECKTYDECKEEIILTGNPIFIEMDITDALGICPTTMPLGTTVSCKECPTIMPCEECATTIPCDTCEECPECPDNTWEYIIGIIVTLIAGMGVYKYGFGYKTYVKESGEIVQQHKHPGIISYHFPNISHKNPKIRHPKGMINPKYRKDADGKWEYIGG